MKRSRDPEDIQAPKPLLEIVRHSTGTPMAVAHKLTILEANEAYARLYGAPSAQFMRGMDMSRTMTPEASRAWNDRYQRRKEGRVLEDTQVYPVLTLQGRRIRIEVGAMPWSANPDIMLITARDITKREQHLDKLRKSESLFRVLADTLPAAVIFRGLSNEVLYANKQASEVTGYSREEIAEGRIVKSTGKADQQVWNESVSRGLPVINRQMEFVHKDGAHRWMSASCRPVLDDEGAYQGMCFVFQDVTDSVMAQEEIRKKGTEIEAIFAAFPDIYLRLDRDGVIVDYRAGRGSVLYLQPEAFLGKRVHDVLPKNVSDLVYKAIEEVRKTGAMTSIEYDLAVAGKDYTFMARVAPFRDGVVSVIQDITQRKRAEEALSLANEDLARAYEVQREFLNNVTHEVRTPLTAIMGYAEMLLEGVAGPLDQQQKPMIRKIMTSSETLLGIVNEVLNLARMKSGAMVPVPRGCNPCEIVGNAAAALLPQARQKGIHLVVNSPPDSVAGIYDEEKLRAIVTNLISNAVKFTHTGGVHVNVNCSNEGVEVVVTDTGMGMTEDEIAAVFDEFKQLEQPRRHKPVGFGLGLAIVARMVETIGATLIVSSRKNLGTAFTLFAPTLKEQKRRASAPGK